MANSVYLTVCDALSHIVSRRAAENIVRDALRVGRTNPDQVTPREMQDLLKGQVFARLQQIIPVAQARGEIKTLLAKLEKMAKAAPKALSPEILEGLEALRAEFEPFSGLEHPRAERIRAGVDSLPESPEPTKALNSLWAELDLLMNEVGSADTLGDKATGETVLPGKATVTLPALSAPIDLDDAGDGEPFPLEMDDVMLEADEGPATPLGESPLPDVEFHPEEEAATVEAEAVGDGVVNSQDEAAFLIPEFDSFGLEFEMEERPRAQPPTLELAPDAKPDAQPVAQPVAVPAQALEVPAPVLEAPAPVVAAAAEPAPMAVPVVAELAAVPELVAAAEPAVALVGAGGRAELPPMPPAPIPVAPIPTTSSPTASSPANPSTNDEQDELRNAFDNEAGLDEAQPEPVAAPEAPKPVAPAAPVRRTPAKLNLTPEAQELLLSRFALEEGVIGVTLSNRMGSVIEARMREGSEDHLAGVAAATAMLMERRRSFDVFYTDLGEANVFIAPLGEALLTVLADRSVNVGRVLSEVKTVKEEL